MPKAFQLSSYHSFDWYKNCEIPAKNSAPENRVCRLFHKQADRQLSNTRPAANIEFRVPYSQRYLFNAIPDTNHNANPTNPTNGTNPNTRYRCEYK